MLKAQVECIPTKWKGVILDYINKNETHWDVLEKKYMEDITHFEGYLEVYPEPQNIFKCFHYFDPQDTKIIILGQDPYHGPNQATGLSFAVKNGTKKPPSLKNIEKVLLNDCGKSITDSSLEKWAKQKILMLNSSLTVIQKTPASHMKFWKPFTNYILEYITMECKNVLFVVWGGFAYDIICGLQPDQHNSHKMIVSSHPSPFSFYRGLKGFPSFKESNVFNNINKITGMEVEW